MLRTADGDLLLACLAPSKKALRKRASNKFAFLIFGAINKHRSLAPGDVDKKCPCTTEFYSLATMEQDRKCGDLQFLEYFIVMFWDTDVLDQRVCDD
jgi:hypothetical protein